MSHAWFAAWTPCRQTHIGRGRNQLRERWDRIDMRVQRQRPTPSRSPRQGASPDASLEPPGQELHSADLALHPGGGATCIPSVPARNLPVRGKSVIWPSSPACKNILLLRRPKLLTSMSFKGRPPNRGCAQSIGQGGRRRAEPRPRKPCLNGTCRYVGD